MCYRSAAKKSLQGLLNKRNRPNARQRRQRTAARSLVENMTFCAPRRVVICVVSLQERLGLGAGFEESWTKIISAQNNWKPTLKTL